MSLTPSAEVRMWLIASLLCFLTDARDCPFSSRNARCASPSSGCEGFLYGGSASWVARAGVDATEWRLLLGVAPTRDRPLREDMLRKAELCSCCERWGN